ncbi:TRAF-type zinc finger domain-containing protein 1-like [Actinia tenebrosa]|uniref:TRAF-type zinc finger domain-containing protein 1-like n=1 Tax=Actinia tenebrosa TaxID=6105 RepID=A0A6P8H7R0_ACTTE|nr:TRAF-type zinc finger domain-containing protein 1-like [Actinia tenebrosa]
MEEEQETKFCSNCKKNIPANNFMVHEHHCQRNITRCDRCQEPVPKSQLDEHIEEYHAKVKCECGESMEKMRLDEHKEDDCKSRKTTCPYCELECTVGEIDSHKEYCGSRTELCEKCNCRIQYRDLEEHLQSDCTLNSNEPIANNNSTNGPSSLQNGLSRNRPEQMVQNFGFGDFGGIALAGGHEVFQRLFTSGFGTLPVGDRFGQDQFFDNRNMFSTNVVPRDNVIARGPSNNRRQGEARRERNSHFVDNRVRNDDSAAQRNDLEKDELMAALLACEDDGDFTGGESYAGFKEPLPGMNHLEDNHYNYIEDDQGADLDETVLPCEFCGGLVKAQDLIQHQTGCQLVSSGSPSLYPQLRSQPRSLPPLDLDPCSDEDQEHNGAIEPHYETLLPCEFCQELFPSDSLIGHQSICDPDRSRPASAIHTFQGSFFESDQQGLNNSPPQTRIRPPRPSRPVVTSGSPDEQDVNLFHPASDLRPSRRVTSGNEGNTRLFNPAGDDDNSSSNNRNIISSSSNDNSRRLASGNSRSQRNNEVHSRRRGPPSNSVPLTVRNGQASRGPMKTQVNRKTTSQHLSRPSRVASDDKKEECVDVLPKRSSPKVTSSSRYGTKYSGLQESGKNSLNNDNELSVSSVNGRYRNGTRNEPTGDELPWEMRPLQETVATYSATASQRPPRKGTSSGGRPFQHSTETRKQMSRLAPSFDKPLRSMDSQKEGSKTQTRTGKKATPSGRNEQRTGSERGAQGTSGRLHSSTKSKTKKKIV